MASISLFMDDAIGILETAESFYKSRTKPKCLFDSRLLSNETSNGCVLALCMSTQYNDLEIQAFAFFA